MRRFKGFTLSELMVALAVIGILVAIVTPAIMKNRPNKDKMMIKKSFYLTEQIVSSLINDENLYPDKRDYCTDGDSTTTCYWGFDDTSEVTFEGNSYGSDTASSSDAKEKFYELFQNRLNVKTVDDKNYIFYTSDGIKWDLSGIIDAWEADADCVGTFDDQDDAAGIGTIVIDVNGDDSPNCLQTASGCSEDNFDQYRIEILANGKMRINPADTKAIEYVTINTSIRDSL